MILVTRKSHFNAAHRLHNPDKSDEWNRQTYGKCNHPHWHGHNYTVEVTVAGNPDPETGYVVDLGDLKDIVEEKIIEPCDHRNLNQDVSFLKGIIPSTENLVRIFYQQLKEPVEQACSAGSKLYSVRLYETDRNFAEYCPYVSLNQPHLTE
ncbi:MAG: 6-pyruvoyl trahydropterin synthase family protein [Bacteroidota bacterium]